MSQSHLNSSTFVTAFLSKSLSSTSELEMYQPFAEALNYALERVSNFQVDGLPELKTHVVFVPCNKRVFSTHKLSESSFKPDLVVMPLPDACKFYGLGGLDAPTISRFSSETTGKLPSGLISWATVLSAVEVKRKKNISGWAPLGAFNFQDHKVSVIQDENQRLDEEPDTSQSTTRKMNALL
jgi:hypothetical protein